MLFHKGGISGKGRNPTACAPQATAPCNEGCREPRPCCTSGLHLALQHPAAGILSPTRFQGPEAAGDRGPPWTHWLHLLHQRCTSGAAGRPERKQRWLSARFPARPQTQLSGEAQHADTARCERARGAASLLHWGHQTGPPHRTSPERGGARVRSPRPAQGTTSTATLENRFRHRRELRAALPCRSHLGGLRRWFTGANPEWKTLVKASALAKAQFSKLSSNPTAEHGNGTGAWLPAALCGPRLGTPCPAAASALPGLTLVGLRG